MRIVLITIGSIIGLFILIFLSNEFEIFGIKFWGVRRENARREVFEQTQSYYDGKRQQLAKYHHEWVNADSDSKKALESTIRSSFTGKDLSIFENDPILYGFLTEILNK
jgi:hypothetical protein